MGACRKRRYRNRTDALIALSRIDQYVRRSGQSDEAPVRAYQCQDCHGWHLTHLATWEE